MSWQEDAVAKLRASGWWQKRMGQRLGRLDIFDVVPMRPEVTGALRQAIIRLFPERAAECANNMLLPGVPSIISFNDHRKTTLEDVERVIRETR